MARKSLFILFIPALFIGCNKIDSRQGSELFTGSLKQIAVYSTAVPEPSGLCYNSKNKSLMTVSDSNGTIYEMDLKGNIIGSLRVAARDLEGIALSKSCDTIYLAEERDQLVSRFLLDGTKISSLSVNISKRKNHSLEGIALDKNNHLFILNEKNPRAMLEYSGTAEIMRKELDFSEDVSDIYYDESENCFWVISDESEAVYKIKSPAEVISKYSIPFSKGEGIAIVDQKIYVVNDSDGKLYVFDKPK